MLEWFGAGRRFPPPVAVPDGPVLLLAEGPSASLDYFLRPHLAASGQSCVVIDSRQPPPQSLGEFGSVVVVRYLPGAWIASLAALRRRGLPVTYFMDDDLMDPQAHRDLPAEYRRKLHDLALRRRRDIERLASAYWVSTPALAAKYAAWNPQVVAPRFDEAPEAALVRICYHGTASHVTEHRWLIEFVAELQRSSERTHFTIVGDHALYRAFRGLPRVSVLHPMSWPNYRALCLAHPCDIGLAPLLPGPFAAARSPTKFLDFVRQGAAGVFADTPPYRGVVRHDVDGLLVSMETRAWLDAVVALVDDAPRRHRIAAAARLRAGTGPLA